MIRNSLNKVRQISISELRGIILVGLGLIALGFYYRWWFIEGRLSSPILVLGFAAAFFYGTFQILAGWLVYLRTHHRPAIPVHYPDNLTVDVFVTVCGEEYSLVEQNLVATCAMYGAHQTWLLDDGHDPALACLAERLGAGYLTRPDRKDAKAGNVNAGLAQTQGDIIVLFDIDHIPVPDFLRQTLGCFTDPAIGFVQVMPTFSNNRVGWVARAATETSLDFYNPTSKGMDGFQSVTKMGSNSLIRRTALNSIGGYQPGLAEDLATSIALHAAGWRSRYVAEPLAPGLAPLDLTAWFTQQLKWARGVFEVLLTTYPRVFRRLEWGQRLSYAVRTTKYLIGPAIFAHMVAIILALFGGDNIGKAHFQQYILHATPLVLLDMIIRYFALQRWRHPSLQTESLWRAMVLVFVTWPIYTSAWMMAVLRLPLSFRPTPKSSKEKESPIWLLPQLISLCLLTVGIIYSLITTENNSSFLILYGFAASLIIPQLSVFRPLLRPTLARYRRKRREANSELVSPNPASPNEHFWP